ncbi:MAG TPA: 2-dehydropantoate 2-reductase [Gaiellaceae bacterium]
MNRTVAVLGPGAVGGSLAVRLCLAHVPTICITHSGTAAAMTLAGLTLEYQGKTLAARPRAVERLEEPVALLLVTVKAPSLEEALDRIDPVAVADGAVLPLLNGLEHMEPLRARLGPHLVAGSISHFQAYRVGRVQIVETISSPIVTMASDDLGQSELEDVAVLLRNAGVEVRIGQSEKRVLWHKLVRIAALAAAMSATGRSIGQLRDDPEWRRRLEEAIAEACTVAEADGVPLRVASQWAIIDQMPDDLTTSAARDIAAGRRSELDAIAGAVLRAGERLGVPCPTLAGLAAQAGLR